MRIPALIFAWCTFFLVSCSRENAKEKSRTVQKDSAAKAAVDRVFIAIPNLPDTCSCDSNFVKKEVQGNAYNAIERFDKSSFTVKRFYQLDSSDNRCLWFRDIETPRQTKFTALWDAYFDKNYFADPVDFIHYYEGKKDIPLAFIFGPNDDLWAYNIFVVKKLNCCYLVSRSYYRHNRFTYKTFAVATGGELKELYRILNKINLLSPETKTSYGYHGYFTDNINNKMFLVDFANEKIQVKDSSNIYNSKPKPEIENLYNFIDSGFHWTQTYGQ